MLAKQNNLDTIATGPYTYVVSLNSYTGRCVKILMASPRVAHSMSHISISGGRRPTWDLRLFAGTISFECCFKTVTALLQKFGGNLWRYPIEVKVKTPHND